MHRILSAAVLTLAFCCPISAGIIHNPAPGPTPLSRGAVLNVSAEVRTPSTGTTAPGVSDSLTELTLDLLAVLLALF